ncbi:MAG TPA: dipeptide/oligopeptide/nickel ABC transporter permease/ATP-binding protein [Acidimicrobiia bacterium]|nr:dipeptide/oligopeptide/nickel ABC transporter permease/ATP-binding protein [Acidimicrobiia bacterium]
MSELTGDIERDLTHDGFEPIMSVAPAPRGDEQADEPAPAGSTPGSFRRAGKRLVRNPVAMISLGFILLMFFLAIFGPALAPYDPASQDFHTFEPISWQHWLGTDNLGRDVLSRMLVGTRVSMQTGFEVTFMVLIVAVPLGLLVGFAGGWLDLGTNRVLDAINAFPALLLALAVAAILGPGLTNAMIAIAIVAVPGLVRLVRAQTLALREETYVEASRSIGTSKTKIIGKRVLPGVISPLVVAATLLLGTAILIEAGLSFLGLGQQPPAPSWGNMLQVGNQYVRTEPMMLIVPGVAISLAVLAFNLFGDSLNDALGLSGTKAPKGQKRGRMGLTSVAPPVASPDPATATVGVEQADATPAPVPLLSVRNLSVEFTTPQGPVTVVSDVSFDVAPGEVLGLVGESGCGKSVTSSAVMRLIASPPGRVTSGEVVFEDRNLLELPFGEMRKLRGNDIAMVFQDPMSSLNPAFTIGNQLVEAIRLHNKVKKSVARRRAAAMLAQVGIPDATARLDDYPHNLSGGMRQRVVIAMALVNEPKLVIADEPTTALDVTVQAQILELLKNLQRDLGMAILFVTHDLGVIADICDRVVVMYAGQVVEQAPVHELFASPQHPYTRALLRSIPQTIGGSERLVSIPGVVPTPSDWPHGCRFADRCVLAIDACRAAPVELEAVDRTLVRCIRHGVVESPTAPAETTAVSS